MSNTINSLDKALEDRKKEMQSALYSVWSHAETVLSAYPNHRSDSTAELVANLRASCWKVDRAHDAMHKAYDDLHAAHVSEQEAFYARKAQQEVKP